MVDPEVIRDPEIINEYVPTCNRRTYSETTTKLIERYDILNISKKEQCAWCNLGRDTCHTLEKNPTNDNTIVRFKHSARKAGENCGWRVCGQNITNCHILFVGPNPTFREVEDGFPFTSASAGNILLRQQIEQEMRTVPHEHIGFTYLVSCFIRSHVPDAEHIRACRAHLLADLEVARPYIIAPVGRSAAYFFVNDKAESNKRLHSIKGHHGPWMYPAYYRGAIIIPVRDPRDYPIAKNENEARGLKVRGRIRAAVRYISDVYNDIVYSGTATRMKSQPRLWS